MLIRVALLLFATALIPASPAAAKCGDSFFILAKSDVRWIGQLAPGAAPARASTRDVVQAEFASPDEKHLVLFTLGHEARLYGKDAAGELTPPFSIAPSFADGTTRKVLSVRALSNDLLVTAESLHRLNGEVDDFIAIRRLSDPGKIVFADPSARDVRHVAVTSDESAVYLTRMTSLTRIDLRADASRTFAALPEWDRARGGYYERAIPLSHDVVLLVWEGPADSGRAPHVALVDFAKRRASTEIPVTALAGATKPAAQITGASLGATPNQIHLETSNGPVDAALRYFWRPMAGD